jgi:hypothetical protein
MDCNDVKPNLRVRTTTLGETTGMMIVPRHLDCRKEGVVGVVDQAVPGHGGDVWFVKHEGSEDIGAYVFNELEPA